MAAASSLPLYQRPRTPSSPPRNNPPYSTPERIKGLGLHQFDSPTIKTHYDYDIQHGISDSPTKQPESGRTDSASTLLSPAFSTIGGGRSPNGSLHTPITPQTASTDGGSFEPVQQVQNNPFNFTPTQYVAPTGKAAEALGKRKGHKYRHSSMHASAMDSIIRPPAMRTPLAVPASLPMPTRKEVRRSVTSNQTYRLTWCLCHFMIAGCVQFIGIGSLSLTALSRLLVFDAAGATIGVIVDVMSNFEVWKRSSIKHPFGLQRADVLAGFGMAVFISFMGLDIISHGIEHSLEDLGTHEAHSPHPHERVPTRSVHIASMLSILSTLISAIVLKPHTRIAPHATNFPPLLLLPACCSRNIFSNLNPSHILTLSSSILLLILLPTLTEQKTYSIFDFVLALLIASSMISLGFRLGTSLASMLLMSHHDKGGVRDVIGEIEAEKGVSGVEEARVWQVHYGLCMANFKLRCRGGGGGGSSEEMVRLRERVVGLVRGRLGGDDDGGGGGKWEVSVQVGGERD